ncbi:MULTISPECIES: MFS transporter [Corallococcus]|uniref:MFS transporter n=1 Tax=Corallococcus TaxID=83461 RepID=UPI001180C1DB|nr:MULTISPECIES: MFS transporter [Corallococcus]NBD12849.1 MFS transporter [Corallococcus silvisoli]TSC23083.1 MFS transporter [Corallococcus sp. Z5C101001]
MPAHRLPRLTSLRPFEYPGYFAVWLGALISNIGTWMETVAMGVYVTQTTGRAEWTGAIVALSFLPAVFLAPVGGALADRFDRRAYAALGALLQAALAGVLTVLAFRGQLSVSAIGVISFLSGCVSTLTYPAFSALLAELVPPHELHLSTSLNSAQFNLGRILGPTLAAVVLQAGGPAWALLANTLSFFAVLVALWRVVPPARDPRVKREPLLDGIVRGITVAYRDEDISLVLVATFFVAALVAPFIGLVPVFAIRELGQGAAATSLLVTCQGAGAVTAALCVGTLAEMVGQGRLRGYAAMSIAMLSGVYWLAPTLQVAAVCIFFLGANYLVLMSSLSASCQNRVPRELQARMGSLYSMVLGAGYSLGVWFQGALADRMNLRLVTLGASALFLTLVLSARLLKPHRFENRPTPQAEVRPFSDSAH